METIKNITTTDIDLGDNTMAWSQNNFSVTGGGYYPPGDGYTYATNTIGTSGTIGISDTWITSPVAHTLSVQGDAKFDGEITIKGRSLAEFMDSVEQRLNMLRPNPEVEAEWDQLRELGERYRELEKLCKEKSTAWNNLKKI